MSLHDAVSEALFIGIFFLLASLPCFQTHIIILLLVIVLLHWSQFRKPL